jgi:hypothetical protein
VPDEPLRRGAFLAALLAFGLAGAALGVVSAFLAGAGPRVGPVLLSVGVLLGVAGTPALVVAACRLTGRAGAGAAPYAAWLGVVVGLSVRHRFDPALNFGFLETPFLVYGGAVAGSVACGLGSLWAGSGSRQMGLEPGEGASEED